MTLDSVVDAELVRSADEWAEVIKADLGQRSSRIAWPEADEAVSS